MARQQGGAGMQEAERIQTEIQKVIGDDPTIQDADRIIVTVEKQSFWKGGKEIVVSEGKRALGKRQGEDRPHRAAPCGRPQRRGFNHRLALIADPGSLGPLLPKGVWTAHSTRCARGVSTQERYSLHASATAWILAGSTIGRNGVRAHEWSPLARGREISVHEPLRQGCGAPTLLSYAHSTRRSA